MLDTIINIINRITFWKTVSSKQFLTRQTNHAKHDAPLVKILVHGLQQTHLQVYQRLTA